MLIIGFVCPTEFSVYIWDLRLPPHRMALIFIVPVALYRLAMRPDIRVRPFEIVTLRVAM